MPWIIYTKVTRQYDGEKDYRRHCATCHEPFAEGDRVDYSLYHHTQGGIALEAASHRLCEFVPAI